MKLLFQTVSRIVVMIAILPISPTFGFIFGQCCRKFTQRRQARLFTSDATVKECMIKTHKRFVEEGIVDAELSARYIVSNVAGLGYKYSDYVRGESNLLSPDQIQRIDLHCIRRLNKEPLQYILGNWDFYGLEFRCEEPVLIPRPETEELVEHIVNDEHLKSIARPRILDIGCGTGVIGISLAVLIPDAVVVAVDISPRAIALARFNAQNILGKEFASRYYSECKSFNDLVLSADSDGTMGLFDLIVSNPPYIPTCQLATLQQEVRCFEDHKALDGGELGFDIILDIMKSGSRFLNPRSHYKKLWLEIDPSHPVLFHQHCSEDFLGVWDLEKIYKI